MNRPRTKGRPTFFWQPVLVLLPVVGLACFGLYSMRQDRLLAEQEARDAGQALAKQLAGTLTAGAGKLLRDYTSANTGLYMIRTAAFGGSEGANDDPQQVRNRQQKNPDIDLAAMPTAQFFLKFQPTPLTPQPPDWLQQLTPEQRQLWQSAQALETVPNHLPDANDALQKFIASNPPVTARANADYLSLLADTRGLPDRQAAEQFSSSRLRYSADLTEAGLPVGQLVFYHALRLMPGGAGLSGDFLRELRLGIHHLPSIISPRLIDEAARVCEGTAAEKEVTEFKSLWNAEQMQREILEDFRCQHPTNAWTKGVFWVHSTAGTYLIDITDLQRWEPSSRPRDAAFVGWIIPGPVFAKALVRAAAEAGISPPPYTGAEIEIAGENITMARDTAATMKNAQHVLGQADGMIKAMPASGDDYPLKVRVVLADANLLYARQRQRTFLFGALILASALAAMIGLYAAYVSFRRQQQLSELKSDFVSSVSHELRAPIASVRLMAEGLERGKIQEPAKQQEYFKFIVQECRRLSSLIENVLDFSRIEEGRKRYEMESTDLVALTQQTVNVMQTYASEQDIRIALSVTGAPAPVDLDGKAIQQALVNLIDNAIKHSPKGSEIAVDLDFNHTPAGAGPSCASISVEDHGEGIAASEQDKIFERFYRVGSELRRETQGVGIGLSIVKHIVEAHGGRVTVRSAPGQGSRFTIELPVNGRDGPLGRPRTPQRGVPT